MALDEEWDRVIYGVFFIILCCIGTVLNVVLLVVFTRHPETRTPGNILLINLCISDLAYLLSFYLTSIGIWSIQINTECYAYDISRSFTMVLNAYSVAAISVQRYVGLVTYRVRLPTDKTDYVYSLLIVAGVWTTATVLPAVEKFIISQRRSTFCEDYFQIGASVYRLFVYGVIPSAIISVFYIAAACRVNRSALHLPGVEYEALQTLREQRKKSARILFALAVVFVVTYTPMLVYICLISAEIDIPDWCNISAFLVMFFMPTLNPIFDPIALCVASRQLRELYHKYCCCCCCRTPADSFTSRVTHNRSVTVEETEF